MKKKGFKLACIIAVLALTVGNVFKSLDTNRYNLMLAEIRALTNEIDDTFDGGEIPEVVITCDSKGWGICYYVDPIDNLLMVWRCKFGGDPNNACPEGAY